MDEDAKVTEETQEQAQEAPTSQWMSLTQEERKAKILEIRNYIVELIDQPEEKRDHIEVIHINPEIYIDFLELWDETNFEGVDVSKNAVGIDLASLKDSIQLIPEEKVPLSGYDTSMKLGIPGVNITTFKGLEAYRLASFAHANLDPLFQKYGMGFAFQPTMEDIKQANMTYTIVLNLLHDFAEFLTGKLSKPAPTPPVTPPTYIPGVSNPGGYGTKQK